MKKHNGMRPHDVAILLKIVSKGSNPWLMKDLANELEISASEISESINRSVVARLISSDKRSVNKQALLEFIQFGLPYTFPQNPGALSKGFATAYSAPPLSTNISTVENIVWTHPKGNLRGQSLEPLHVNTPSACLKDKAYYELMALTDAIRIGRTREKALSLSLMKDRFDTYS